MPEEQPSAGGWTTAVELPAHFTTPVLLDMTTLEPRPIQAGVMRSLVDGKFYEYEWFTDEKCHRWRPISAEKAEALCTAARAAEYRGRTHWLELFGEPPPGAKRMGSEQETLSGEEKALALLVAHPEWSNSKIAEAVPCARTTLYDWPRFKAARNALKARCGSLPRGAKDKEGKLEAWDE